MIFWFFDFIFFTIFVWHSFSFGANFTINEKKKCKIDKLKMVKMGKKNKKIKIAKYLGWFYLKFILAYNHIWVNFPNDDYQYFSIFLWMIVILFNLWILKSFNCIKLEKTFKFINFILKIINKKRCQNMSKILRTHFKNVRLK